MYILLTLFFISLIGIIVMIGRRLILLRNGQILVHEENHFRTPHFKEWKTIAIKNIKKHGYTGLVVTIRYYVRGTNLLKNKYQEVKTKIKEKGNRSINNEKREISKFLKTISEYKHKIREIKHKIHEEEKNL